MQVRNRQPWRHIPALGHIQHLTAPLLGYGIALQTEGCRARWIVAGDAVTLQQWRNIVAVSDGSRSSLCSAGPTCIILCVGCYRTEGGRCDEAAAQPAPSGTDPLTCFTMEAARNTHWRVYFFGVALLAASLLAASLLAIPLEETSLLDGVVLEGELMVLAGAGFCSAGGSFDS